MTANEKRQYSKVQEFTYPEDKELKNILTQIKLEQDTNFITAKNLSDQNRGILEKIGYSVVKVTLKGETSYNISW